MLYLLKVLGVCVCALQVRAPSRQAHMRILLAGRLVPDIRDFQASWESYSFLPKLYAMQGKQKKYLLLQFVSEENKLMKNGFSLCS